MPRWLLWTAAAVVSWGVWAALPKLIGGGLSSGQSQALSTAGLVPVILALCWSKNLTVRPVTRRGVFYALAGGAVSCLGNLPYFDLLGRGTKAAAVVPLTALYPIVTVALAVALLRERINRVQGVGVALSLLAIYLFNVPEEGGLVSGWLAYAFLPMALWGAAGFLQKLATGHLSGELAALLVLVGFLLVSVLLLLIEPWPAEVSPRTWVLVTALGLTLAFGNYAVVRAYAHGQASVITPLAGLYPLVSVPIAVLFLGETVGPREAIGIGCAVVAVVALALETPPEVRSQQATTPPDS
jgi:drug/metabolite transporter (DMT)-like permease